MHNLLRIPETVMPGQGAEYFENLLSGPGNLRVERIISHGHVTPQGEWLDQDEDEWVLLLEGSAGIAFPDGREVSLYAGDSLLLPKHARHRVSRTSSPCIWLAVFAQELGTA